MLLKVKQLLKKPIVSFYKKRNFRKFQKYLTSQKERNKLIIFDLDNTLAHTFPELHKPDTNEMYKNIPPHNNMVNLANVEFNSSNDCLILTARDYKYRSATQFWLAKHIKADKIPLFIVPSAKDKIRYLNLAIQRYNEVMYYDDLSYNHEKGEVKFYTDVIEEVEKLPLKYIGYKEINDINTK